MRGTSSERLGAAFNLEVQSRRHCILHSGLSEKRPPTSFAVYHFSMTLKLAICCAIPNWCGKETTALILSFFFAYRFPRFLHSSKPWETHALSFRQNYSSLFGVNLHGLWAERCSRQNFGLILLSFCCRFVVTSTNIQRSAKHLTCGMKPMPVEYQSHNVDVHTAGYRFVFLPYRFTVNGQ
jgi:hypothetical protein